MQSNVACAILFSNPNLLQRSVLHPWVSSQKESCTTQQQHKIWSLWGNHTKAVVWKCSLLVMMRLLLTLFPTSLNMKEGLLVNSLIFHLSSRLESAQLPWVSLQPYIQFGGVCASLWPSALFMGSSTLTQSFFLSKGLNEAILFYWLFINLAYYDPFVPAEWL